MSQEGEGCLSRLGATMRDIPNRRIEKETRLKGERYWKGEREREGRAESAARMNLTAIRSVNFENTFLLKARPRNAGCQERRITRYFPLSLVLHFHTRLEAKLAELVDRFERQIPFRRNDSPL